ncbi:MAG: type II secretion system F family protein [Pseudomonadota bacterium]
MSFGLLMGLLLVFATAAAVAFAAYFFYPRLESSARQRLSGYVAWVITTQDRMFQPVPKSKVYAILAASTGVCVLAGFLLSWGYGWLTVAFTLVFGWLGWSAPRVWINYRWQQRLKKFDEQLVDGLNLMANSLKSGLNLNQVIEVLVSEMPIPISQEFGLVISQQKLGLSVDDALEKMLDRIPSDDLAVAIHSVLILRETGGDLSETFDVIAQTIRERRKVDGKIKAMTTQGKTQGFLLVMMPPGLGLALYYVNPDFLTPLFTTEKGLLMILAMVVLQVIGALWIKKIVTIDV